VSDAADRPRCIVITGASSGLGRALALDLAVAGDTVIGTVRSAADAERLQRDGGGGVTPIVLDVRDRAAVARLARDVDAIIGDQPLDALVNNAGVVVAGPLEELDLDRVHEAFEVNVLGTLAVTRALLPLLRRGRGRVVNVGSISAHVPAPFLAPYAASKAALGAMTRALRFELAPTGVDVCLVEPGNHRSELRRKAVASLDVTSPVYGPALRRAVNRADGRAAHDADAAAFVAAVRCVLDCRRSRAAYLVGRDAVVLAALRRWLPYGVFEGIVRRVAGGAPADRAHTGIKSTADV
jgi:NAD(P)-dependent dehydrogenase (short-subunit alcohol dehydrogenase family)